MFNFSIISPEKTIYQHTVHSITIPGEEGYFQVLSNHAPLISIVKEGKLTVTDQNKKKQFWKVSGGIFEVALNQAALLADSAEMISE